MKRKQLVAGVEFMRPGAHNTGGVNNSINYINSNQFLNKPNFFGLVEGNCGLMVDEFVDGAANGRRLASRRVNHSALFIQSPMKTKKV